MSRVLDARFLTYLVVGVIQWLVDVLVYSISWPLVGVAGAQGLARLSGAIVGFQLNRHHTFGAAGSRRQTVDQALKFTIVWIGNWACSTALVLWLMQTSGLSEVPAKICVDLLVVPSNFLLLKKWVFAPPEEGAPDKE